MKKFLKSNRIFNGSLQRQLLLITLTGTLSACIIIFLVSFYIFKNYLRDNLISTAEYGLYNLYESINNDLLSASKLVRYCQTSPDISAFVEESNDNSRKRLSTYDRLQEEYQTNDVSEYIPRIVVANSNTYIQVCQTSYSTVSKLSETLPKLSYFDELLDSDTYNFSTGITNEPFTNIPTPVVTVIRPITCQFNANPAGYVYMEIFSRIFTDHMSQYYMEEGSSLYLVLGQHVYLYDPSNGGALIEITNRIDKENLQVSPVESSMHSSFQTQVLSLSSHNDSLTAIVKPLSFPDCYIVQTIPQTKLTSQWRFFLLLFIIVIASIIAIEVSVGISLMYYIHRPLAKIQDKISRTSAGDFSRDPSIEWNHELGEVGKGINDLSENVKRLLDTRLEDEKQKRDLEYQILQSQINPHFLYNTLNSIKMMSLMQGATGISEMTTSLASLLRSISKGTSLLVPIREELSLINDYFIIQNYRYGGLIQFDIEISDPEIEEAMILKFTLQPLVENAIFHGLEPKGGVGNISIKLYYSEDHHIYIDVRDNGVGITPERIKEVMNNFSDSSSDSSSKRKSDFFKEIGINNVNKRLQYEFGEDCGIVPFSQVGEYTIMRVILPGHANVEEDGSQSLSQPSSDLASADEGSNSNTKE